MGYHFDENKKHEGWTEQEMKEGFIPGEVSAELPAEVDMSRRMDMIGKPEFERRGHQVTRKGRYDTYYDEQGYCIKASLVKGGINPNDIEK